MNPTKTYFSLVQYTPDPARHEAVNVGVVLLCPEARSLTAKFVAKNARIRSFFGDKAAGSPHLEAMKKALWNRLQTERAELLTLEGFERFVASRGNEFLLTTPKLVRTTHPETELEVLFAELVDAPEAKQSVAEGVSKVLQRRLDNPSLAPFLRRNLHVEVPALGRNVDVPFGFQNGRFNLIQPVQFSQKSAERITDAACKYAVEGRSLFEHQDRQLGRLQLVVVAGFSNPAEEAKAVLRKMFDDYNVRLFEESGLAGLEREILEHGRLLM